MARALKVNTDYDLVRVDTGHGFTFAMVEGVEAMEQRLDLRFKTREGEDPYDPLFGLPMPKLIAAGSRFFVEGSIKRAAMRDPHALNASARSEERDDEARGKRYLRVDVRVGTDEGTVETGIDVI